MKKKLTILFLQISLVCMGVSVLVDSVSATKKDAERALELIRQARAAVGGENAIKNVQNLSMKGKSHRILKVKNQADRELSGDFEMAVILPDQIIRMEKFGVETGGEANEGEFSEKEIEAIEDEVTLEFRKEEGEAGEEGEKGNFEAVRMSADDEMYRFTLGFLLTPPKGANLNYDYSGEETIDGHAANVIVISSGSKTVMRLYLDKQSNLPLMMSYKGFAPHVPEMMERGLVKERVPAGKDVLIMREPCQSGSKELPDKIIFNRRIDKGELPADGQMFKIRIEEPAEADIQLKFSDYRVVNGIKLPHQLTEIVNGNIFSTTTIDAYEINAPNMAERFKHDNVRIRVRHPE